MILKFVKDHVAGFGKGYIGKFGAVHGSRLINEKFAEEATEKDLASFKYADYEKAYMIRKEKEKDDLIKEIEKKNKK